MSDGWRAGAYRLLLRALPTDVRAEHGREMLHAFLSLRDGAPDAAARRRLTLRAYGDVVHTGLGERWRRLRTRSKDTTTGRREGMTMADFTDDVRLSLRGLARRRASSAVLVLTLALGIGASTAVFSVLQGVLFRPLPYEDADRIVSVRHRLTVGESVALYAIPGPDLLDYIDGVPSLEGLGSIQTLETNLADDRGAARVTIGWVTPDFFDVLRTETAVGRMLVPSDWTPRTRAQMEDPTFAPPPMPVLLSHELWSDRFGADPDLLGRGVDINGTNMLVLGIMRPGFQVYAPADSPVRGRIDAFSYMPIPLTEGQRGAGGGITLARLADGATLEQARTELERVTASLVETHERHARFGTQMVVAPLLDGVVGTARTFLWVLFGSIGLVLLIAVLNVANLLLVRAAERGHEFAVRAALGGSRARVVRQLLTESLVVAALGAVAGILVAAAGIDALVALAPADLPRLEAIRMDRAVVLFATGVSTLAALLFGLAPALTSTRVSPGAALATRGSVGSGPPGSRLRGTMIVGEVALSVLLVAGAGLLLRSASEIAAVDPGYEPGGAVALQVALPFFSYRPLERRQAFFEELLTRARAVPGVTAAGVAPSLPLAEPGWSWSASFGRPGDDLSAPDAARARYRIASAGFLEAIGARVAEGRSFTDADGPGGETVVLLDRRLADRLWPDGDAVGASLDVSIGAYIGQGRQTTARVVGVVEPVRYTSLVQEDEPVIWLPFHEAAPLDATLVLRGSADPTAAAAEVREILADLDRGTPVYAMRRLTDDVEASTARTRYALLLVGVFAATALALAAVGLYGLVSYSVERRTREIGVRLALGARGSSIRSMVLVQGGRLVAIGLALGGLGSVLMGPTVESLLFQVRPADPVTLAGTALLLGAVSMVAAWLPARRASRMDPVDAMRVE